MIVFVYLFPHLMSEFKGYAARINLKTLILQWILIGILWTTGSLPSSFHDQLYWIGYIVINICGLPLLFFCNYKLIQHAKAKSEGNLNA